MSRTAAFYTLGCRLNQTESSIMAKGLENIGYQIIEDDKRADLCVINTCTVTNQSDAKCRKRIRAIQKSNPNAIIAVVGCFSQVSSQQIIDIGDVDIILGNEEKLYLHEYVLQYTEHQHPIVKVSPISKTAFQINTLGQHLESTRANLKVQDGCDFVCSYCIIPRARGRSRPRTPENILEEAETLAKQGVKEIVLTGVNIGTFQYESKRFIELVNLLESVDGIQRIRISSIEPTTIGTEIFELMRDPNRKLTPHLHLPLQSGSDEILKRMRRKYLIDEYADYALQAARDVPDICIGSDVIVGFPGETDRMFEETLQVLTELPIAYFHVFPFAVRKGTTAEKLPDKVNDATITRRATLLRSLSEKKRMNYYRRYLGRTLDVLFESQTPEMIWRGYSENYIRVGVNCADDLKNKIRSVKITAVEKSLARGEIIKDQ